MRKSILAIALVLTASFAPLAHAQTVPSQDRNVLLTQLITLLQQELVILEQQLADQTGATTTSATIAALQSNTQVVTGNTKTTGTIGTTPMPELTCSLDISPEVVAKVYNPGDTVSVWPTGTFHLSWEFTEGATAALSSDALDSEGNDPYALQLTKSSGTIDVSTKGISSFTITVSQEGHQDVSCNAVATHAK